MEELCQIKEEYELYMLGAEWGSILAQFLIANPGFITLNRYESDDQARREQMNLYGKLLAHHEKGRLQAHFLKETTHPSQNHRFELLLVGGTANPLQRLAQLQGGRQLRPRTSLP